MTKKSKKIKGGGMVYSTDQETMASLFSGIKVNKEDENTSKGDKDTLKDLEAPKHLQNRIRVWIDRKSRGGKEVTIIQGIEAEDSILRDLATFIKTKCGVGGSVKEQEIIIQGNQWDKVVEILLAKGFKDVKKAGG